MKRFKLAFILLNPIRQCQSRLSETLHIQNKIWNCSLWSRHWTFDVLYNASSCMKRKHYLITYRKSCLTNDIWYTHTNNTWYTFIEIKINSLNCRSYYTSSIFHISLFASYLASNNIILFKIRVAQFMHICLLQK